MSSVQELKRRQERIRSTQQITKAMKLVSTVKLQRAREHAEPAAVYVKRMREFGQTFLGHRPMPAAEDAQDTAARKKLVVVFSANRGLAGGYNMNIVKKVIDQQWSAEDVLLCTVGRRAAELLRSRGFHVWNDFSDEMDTEPYELAGSICRAALRAYENGHADSITVVYTKFYNAVTQLPVCEKLIPVQEPVAEDVFTVESDEDLFLGSLLSEYVTARIYGALLESAASEHGSRMQAMDAATANADELIEQLAKQYNRARQGAITQEITEIIAGAQAI